MNIFEYVWIDTHGITYVLLYALLTTSVILLLYSTTDKFNLNLWIVKLFTCAALVTIEFISVSVYRSKSTLEPTISETGNNFLLNEPIMEGKIKPYDLHWVVTAALAAVFGIDNICAPVLLFWQFDPLPSA